MRSQFIGTTIGLIYVVLSLNTLQTKEGCVVFGLGGYNAQTERHNIYIFLMGLAEKTAKSHKFY